MATDCENYGSDSSCLMVDAPWSAMCGRCRTTHYYEVCRRLDAARVRVGKLEDTLRRKGYQESCDIAACNCGAQWAHGGHAERRLHEVIDERDELKERLAALEARGTKGGRRG